MFDVPRLKNETNKQFEDRLKKKIYWYHYFSDFVAERNLNLHDRACNYADKREGKQPGNFNFLMEEE